VFVCSLRILRSTYLVCRNDVRVLGPQYGIIDNCWLVAAGCVSYETCEFDSP